MLLLVVCVFFVLGVRSNPVTIDEKLDGELKKLATEVEAQERQISGEELRLKLAAIIAATQNKETQERLQDLQQSLGDFGPNHVFRTGTTEATTAVEELETTTEEITTTTIPTTTTPDPASFAKEGYTVDLVAADITAGGNSVIWSETQQVLYIADLWGSKIVWFKEIDPEPTTIATTAATTEADTTTEEATITEEATTTDEATTTEADTTVDNRLFRAGETTVVATTEEATTTEDPTTTQEPTTTEIPTTTEAPLAYEMRTFDMDKDRAFFIQPRKKDDGMFAVAVPAIDKEDLENDEKFVFSYNNQLKLVPMFMWDNMTSTREIGKWLYDPSANAGGGPYSRPTAGWPDPEGNLLVGTVDLRPFVPRLCNANLNKFLKNFDNIDVEEGFGCEPAGMAWSNDTKTMYYSDSVTNNITQYDYNTIGAKMSNPTVLVDFMDWSFIKGTPKGIATDESDHLWVALRTADSDDSSSVIEIDPKNVDNGPITTIVIPDPDIVDLSFGSEERDRLYVLTETSLYKIIDLGVFGNPVGEFKYEPEDKRKRSVEDW